MLPIARVPGTVVTVERALREACQRLDLARACADEVLVRAEQLGYVDLIDATDKLVNDLEWARAIAEGCAPPDNVDDQPPLFAD